MDPLIFPASVLQAHRACEVWLEQREHPCHLAKMSCGHLERFVLVPKVGWGEWCSTCHDFQNVVDGV